MKTAVIYYRTSSQRGPLQAPKDQVEAVHRYRKKRPDLEVVEEVVDRLHERKRLWPVLAAVAQTAKEKGALLIIAKLGKLYLNAEFIRTALQAAPAVRFLDHPELVAAPDLYLHALELREWRSKKIRKRMAEMKGQGWKFGTDNLTQKGRWMGAKRSGEKSHQAAEEFNAPLYPLLGKWKSERKSLRKMADELNRAGYRTRRGNRYSAMQVRFVLARMQQE